MPDKIITTEQLQRIEHLFGQISTTLNALRQAETTPMPPPQPITEPVGLVSQQALDAANAIAWPDYDNEQVSIEDEDDLRKVLEAAAPHIIAQALNRPSNLTGAVAETDDAPIADRCQHDKRGKCECLRCPGCGYAIGSQACEESPDHAAPGHQPIKLTDADPASGAPLTDVFDQAAVIVENDATGTAIGLVRANARLQDYRRTASVVLDSLRRFAEHPACAQAIQDLEALAGRDREHAKFWTLPPAEPFCTCGATTTDPTHRARAAAAPTEWHLIEDQDGAPYPDDIQQLARAMYQAGRADAGYFPDPR